MWLLSQVRERLARLKPLQLEVSEGEMSAGARYIESELLSIPVESDMYHNMMLVAATSVPCQASAAWLLRLHEVVNANVGRASTMANEKMASLFTSILGNLSQESSNSEQKKLLQEILGGMLKVLLREASARVNIFRRPTNARFLRALLHNTTDLRHRLLRLAKSGAYDELRGQLSLLWSHRDLLSYSQKRAILSALRHNISNKKLYRLDNIFAHPAELLTNEISAMEGVAKLLDLFVRHWQADLFTTQLGDLNRRNLISTDLFPHTASPGVKYDPKAHRMILSSLDTKTAFCAP